ncbi:MAG: hypothetical protein GY829_02475 [Gammaproteobacteria bacterium]|nr:hypothetical protein [Gammaproteobacteria bacterium]
MRVTHFILMLLLLSITIQSRLYAKTLYSHQQAVQILNQKKISIALNELVKLKSTIAGTDKITAWINDPGLEPLLKEKLLYEATLIARRQSDGFDRATMEKLVNYQVEAYLPLNDGGHIIEIAAFQVAASAKATLLHWDIAKYASKATKQLNSNPELFVDELYELNSQDIALHGYVKTINEAPLNQLEVISNIISHNRAKLPVKALLAIVDKTEDINLYQTLIEQYEHNKNNQSLVIRRLSSLPDSISDVQKVELLLTATDNIALKDAATLAMAPYVDSYNQIQTFLFNSLSNKQHGGAAAKALSASKDLLTIEKLTHNLKEGDTVKARYSLLALSFNNSFQAKKALTTFRDSTNNLQLKNEVDQWQR